MKYYKKTEEVCTNVACLPKDILDVSPVFVENGDGTVVTPSASNAISKKYFVNLSTYNKRFADLVINRNHADILEVSPVLDLLKNSIKSKTTDVSFVTYEEPTSSSEDKRIKLSGHSPISIDLYDTEGRHTGLIQNPNPTSDLQLVKEEIPNSYYMQFGEGKYVGFSNDGSVTAKIAGTGIGTFTLKLEEYRGGTKVSDLVYEDIPVLPTTKAELIISTTSQSNLIVDLDGDGAVDFTLKPSEVFDSVQYLLAMKNVIIGFDLKKNIERNLLNKIDVVIKKLQKNKTKIAQNKITKYMHLIQTSKQLQKKIDDKDKKIIVDMLNKLLDNLN